MSDFDDSFEISPPMRFLLRAVGTVLIAGWMLVGAGIAIGAVNMVRLDHAPIWVAALVGGCGLAIAASAILMLDLMHFRDGRAARRLKRQKVEFRYQPWMARTDWSARRMVDRQSRRAIGIVIFASLFIILITGLGATNFTNGKLDIGGLVVLIIIGLVALCVAIRTIAAVLRTGDGTLVLETMPGRQGSRLQVRFLSSLTARRLGTHDAVFSCSRMVQRRLSPRHRLIGLDQILWTQTLPLTGSTVVDGVRTITLQVDLPPDLPDTGQDSEGRVIWQLRIVSRAQDAQGPLFAWQFPVFGAAASGRSGR